jgi:hypothetical protein
MRELSEESEDSGSGPRRIGAELDTQARSFGGAGARVRQRLVVPADA